MADERGAVMLAVSDLRRTETMLARLFQASPDHVSVTEAATGRFVLVNEGFVRMLGYSRTEAIGQTTVSLGLWRNLEDRQRFVDALKARGEVRDYPTTWLTKDRRELVVLCTAVSFDIDGTTYIAGTARDITEQERRRLELAAILDNAQVGIAVTRDRTFQHVNPRWEEIFGWPPGEMAGRPGADVWLTAQDYEAIGRRFGPSLGAGQPVDFEHRMRRRDGTEIWCRVRAKALDPSHPTRGGTIWIVDDISERRRAEQALAAAKEQAEAANRAKSEFLANTSHEIRTPLNALLGLARLGLAPGIDAAKQREYLRHILDSAESLAALISDVLDLARIEAGRLTLDRRSFDLHQLAHGVRQGFGELAAAKGLALALRIDPRVPIFVTGDPVRVRQILSNYLSNAIKFTGHGGVTIELTAAGEGRVRLIVHDTGIGIDAAARARLFQPFSQVDPSTTREFGGTGLGLSICRQLAELMGGSVGVESESGRGSTFWTELPLPAAAPVDIAPAPIDAGAPRHADGVAGRRVLLVEDNAINVMVAEAMLQQWGINVVVARDGREAIAAVAREFERSRGGFDAVLMDMHMPGMSGVDATLELRKRYDAAALPIIAVTAAALASERERSLAIGMNDFVSKPIDADQLRRALQRCIGAARQESPQP